MQQQTKINDVKSIIQDRIDELNGKPSSLRTDMLLTDMLRIRSLSDFMSVPILNEVIRDKIAAIESEGKKFQSMGMFEDLAQHSTNIYNIRQENLQEILSKINK